MPLLKIAQTHAADLIDMKQSYQFSEAHRGCWKIFWNEMDGDIDAILEFAKTAEISHPEDWVNSLHDFLFDGFTGNPKLLKKASKDFEVFLKQIAENHLNNPKEHFWYMDKGVDNKDFVRIMEHAASCKEDDQKVSFINARIPDFGAKLYSEYILSRADKKAEIRSIASSMNKKAYDIETKNGCITIEIGDEVAHVEFPDKTYTISDLDGDGAAVIIDENGTESFVDDLWNLEKI